MKLKKWCAHIKIKNVGGFARYCLTDKILTDNKYTQVSHWNYCPICGKKNPMKED